MHAQQGCIYHLSHKLVLKLLVRAALANWEKNPKSLVNGVGNFFFFLGKYVTLASLKQMKNGDMVQIYRIQSDRMDVEIPSDIDQEEKTSLEKFDKKIYFKHVRKVTVSYVLNLHGQQLKSIRLDNLKEVSN